MILDKLKHAGFRITAPRKAVIEVLESNHEPKSAQEIHEMAKGSDLVSIYRVLEVFEELDIVQREVMQGADKFYLAENVHHHITCRKCGKMECIPCEHLFKSINGFTDIKHQLSLIGTCLACSK